MFRKILIADRGEIAIRVIMTCRKMGIATVAVFSVAEKDALHAKIADESYCIGSADYYLSYMDGEKILSVAKKVGADAIHPGYGFLAEDIFFAKRCAENNIVFIGPGYQTMEQTCEKINIKQIANSLKIPVAKSGIAKNQAELRTLVTELDYPVMIKKKKSAGEYGNYLITNKKDMMHFETYYSNLENMWYVEKYLPCARHIKVQIIGDCSGKLYILGDSDCSVRIGNKKMIEESPAVSISQETRKILYEYARKIGHLVNYTNFGAVEFLVNSTEIVFWEINSRITVDHGVTELVTGTNVVALQIKAALKDKLRLADVIAPRGQAIECRINAQTTGVIRHFSYIQNEATRFDHMLKDNAVITPHYDSLLGKAMAWDLDRANAIHRVAEFLENISISGIETNLGHLKQIVKDKDFILEKTYNDSAKLHMNFATRKNSNISPREKLQEIIDKGSFLEYDQNLVAGNCIQFVGYDEKIDQARKNTGELEAVITGEAFIDGIDCIIIIMNPAFIMGSMGLAVGEKITRAFEKATQKELSVISVAASGGARLQEGIFSLFQMAKTVDAVKRHSNKGLLYLSIISNPTLGGVSASFASLGDIILMEDDAVFGFTGKRIVEETTGKKVTEEFQTATFHFENGHIDRIVKKENLRNEIARILRIHVQKNITIHQKEGFS